MKKPILKSLVAAVGLVAGSAFAVPVTVTFPAESDVFRYNPGVLVDLDETAIRAALPQDGSSGTIFDTLRAGEFKITVTDALGTQTNMFAFCIELDQNIEYATPLDTYQRLDFGPGSTEADRIADNGAGVTRVGRDAPFGDATKFALLSNLYSQFGDLADNSAVLAAAFQIALWEIRYDASLSLEDGSFVLADANASYAGGDADALAARGTAADWLKALTPTIDPLTSFIQLTSNDFALAEWQDLISFTPDTRVPPNETPEPGILALLGLGALGLSRRRS